MGAGFAELAFGQAGDEDSAVEDVGEADGEAGRAEQVAGEATDQHRSQPGDHRSVPADSLGGAGFGVTGPESFQAFRFADLAEELGAESVIGQQWHDVGQGGTGAADQGQTRRAEYVVHPWSPRRLVEAAEDRDHAVGDQFSLRGMCGVQNVPCAGGAGVVRVDDHEPVRAGCGESVDDVAGEVALRVDQHDAAAGVSFAEDVVGQPGRLPRPRHSLDVQVVAGVRDSEPDQTRASDPGFADEFHPLPVRV